jgi:hypothetical protein
MSPPARALPNGAPPLPPGPTPSGPARITRRLACQGLLAGLAGCASEPRTPPPLVLAVPPRAWEGESPQMAARLRGRVIVNRAGQGLEVLDLARPAAGLVPLAPRPLDASGQPLAIWDTSPPDGSGSVAVLTAAPGERRHALRLLSADRGPRTLHEGSGEPLWDRPVSALALSADGRRLAFVTQEDPTARHRPLHRGRLAVLDLGGSLGGPAAAIELDPAWAGIRAALGQRPGWLPGHTRLVYAAAGPQGRALAQAPAPERQPDPELRLLDLARGTDERLADGHSPLVSTDGQSVLLTRGPAFDLVVLELSSGRERRVPRRHGLGLPVAWIESRYLVYTGAPHPQAPPGQTTHNSPLVGPKAMRALKVQDLPTGEVLTLLEGVDPRVKVTAGL